ncbi:glycosyltransferase [Sphingobacterium psychroaquaticum]|uniref:glycosyltransferase n=1 Tax=Sphingobacterium psychroaquaticum TaxID=561061 RepID=UPI001068E842|nr:glycosyltransferase [Sphingobacterium psychroaquaticum]QBQ42231.1 glycosyltransferase [Sphingobacterium psychroaquaticum]
MGVISAFLRRNKQIAELDKAHSFQVSEPNTERNPIHFPSVEEPLVSILISFHNSEMYTRKCLQSILKNLPKNTFEILLIDINSSEAVDFTNITGVTLIQNPALHDFVQATNQGIHQARGEYIYLLNSSTIVREGFLDELLHVFETNNDVGAVGSMLLDSTGKLYAAGTAVLKNAKITPIKGVKSYFPQVNYTYKVDYCSAHSLLFKKKDIHGDLNLLDDAFSLSSFADADLCFRLKYNQGRSTYYTPFSKVVCYTKNTSNENVSHSVRNKSFSKNLELFKQKWKRQIEAIKSTSIHHRILDFYDGRPMIFFNDQVPQYDNNSGELRLTEIIKAYKELNYHVTLVTLDNTIYNAYNAYFQKLGIAVLYINRRHSNISDYFKTVNYVNPIIWMHSATTFNRFYETARKIFKTFSLIFDMVDIHHLRYKRELELFPRDLGIQQAYETYLEIETRASLLADIVIPISDQEKQYMQSFSPEEKMLVISNVHYPKVNVQETPKFEDRTGLLFIGSRHTPNIDAINYMIDEIMPIIWKTDNTIKLHIVGNVAQCFSEDRKSISNVIFHGFVPEVSSYFLKHRVMVAPLRYGAGVKGKIGQALEYHLPVVSSSIGAEGMHLVDGRHILVAENPEDFAKKTISLYTDEKIWKEIQENSISGLKPFSKEVLHEKIKQIEEILKYE